MNSKNKNNGTKSESSAAIQPASSNKSYQKPKLQQLGDLRSLTLGATGPDFDSGNQMNADETL